MIHNIRLRAPRIHILIPQIPGRPSNRLTEVACERSSTQLDPGMHIPIFLFLFLEGDDPDYNLPHGDGEAS
jgi:hypothetical protein